MFKKIILASILLFLLAITSCGTSEPEFDLSLVFYEMDGDWEQVADLVPTVHTPGFDWELLRYYERDADRRHIADVSPFYGETLTVLVDHDWFSRHRMRVMSDNFMRMHPGVNIEFTFLHEIQRQFDSPFDDYEDIMCLLRAQTAPILMQTWSAGLRGSFMNTEKRGFFADWLPIMTNHPDFDTDEWNMNVLYASRIHGELFTFPTFQYVPLVAANRSVPGLAQIFEIKESISASEILDLYIMHGGFETGANIISQYMAWYIHHYVLPNFFNTHDGTIAFYTQEFIELLQNLYYNVNFIEEWNIEIDQNRHNFNFELDRIFGENSFFHHISDSFDNFDAFSFTRHDAYFINPLPFVTGDGRLIVFPLWFSDMNSWILNTHDPISQALAADFILYMANVFGNNIYSPFYDPAGTWSLWGIPAKLSAAEDFASEVERQWVRRNRDFRLPPAARQWRDGYCHETAAETLGDLKYRLGSMEMVKVVHTEYLDTILWEETFYFVDGTRTAEQTAVRLQNRVMAYFSEWNQP